MAAGLTSSTPARVFLRTGRDGPVRGGNPWIFSQAIARVEPADAAPGTIASVMSSGGDLLGLGYLNPSRATTIAVRMLAWGEAPNLETLVARRIDDALALRHRIIASDTNCYRLLNGDGDALSGIVVDRYNDVLVVQLLTAGADRMRELLVRELQRAVAPRAIIERSIGAVRKQEGLEDRTALLAGEPVSDIIVSENGVRIFVDFEHGQKTGCFLDQRENRALVGALAADASILDAYCYGGGFTLAALNGGARRAVAIDTSARALGWARRNLELNDFAQSKVELSHDEAGRFMAATDERFDVVVLDPPPLARSRADAERAGRLYVELNSLAMRALARGGRMLTFSCSAHFRGEDFVRAVRIAGSKSGRPLRMLRHLGPGGDHPVLLGHAEGEYLTGLLLVDL
jgi:23S rRNA (cytosine1962-C5)-methyltransferase